MSAVGSKSTNPKEIHYHWTNLSWERRLFFISWAYTVCWKQCENRKQKRQVCFSTQSTVSVCPTITAIKRKKPWCTWEHNWWSVNIMFPCKVSVWSTRLTARFWRFGKDIYGGSLLTQPNHQWLSFSHMIALLGRVSAMHRRVPLHERKIGFCGWICTIFCGGGGGGVEAVGQG
jgi:hypothetical protein